MNLFSVGQDNTIVEEIKGILSRLEHFDNDSKIEILNRIKKELHEISPMKHEPVDCVLWVKNEQVHANDYNPNSVAPPEMELLEHSILNDGYTQPIVSYNGCGSMNEVLMGAAQLEVIDGFHRNRVGKESKPVKERVLGYLPVVVINASRSDKGDRMAATIRHNRARGKHKVESMSDIVMELKRRNWSDEKIGKELGMEPDEVLRLTQIQGLSEMFADRDFSEAWEADLEPVQLIEE